MIRVLQRCAKQICNNSDSALLQLAAVAALFVLLGDLIAFILAIISLHDGSNNSCSVQAQVNRLEKQIAQKNQVNQEIIKILEDKLSELKTNI